MHLGYYRLRYNLLKIATRPNTTDPDTPNTMAHPPDDFADIIPDAVVDAQQNMYGNTEDDLQQTSPMPTGIEQNPVIAKISSIRGAVKRRYAR